MKYSQRHRELNTIFELGLNKQLADSNIDIQFFPFQSTGILSDNFISIPDKTIQENQSFIYPVFSPKTKQKKNEAILLLHGLNERNWSKYLTWAEFLCSKTGKAVILFPIAFHINRSPQSWSNPRDVRVMMDLRRQRNGEDRSLSFANVTFSERISERPYRFYTSGRQSVNDLTQLFSSIKTGNHPAFAENTHIDIFSYSIGAFLSEITLMSNPNQLFTDSKLFMFCGGGIFSSMFGESRSIMDKKAFEQLFQFYLNDFATTGEILPKQDSVFESFYSMISPERKKSERFLFFEKNKNRIGGISMLRDKVMPYQGIVDALGTNCATTCIIQKDFSFEYSHENPFPTTGKVQSEVVDEAFNTVFMEAADFLG